jgi:CBS domain containing-hemolysin-like protein
MSNLAIIILSVVLSGFFSGMEIAFISSNKLRIELDKKQGAFGSRIISFFTGRPGEYIATMLVGNNISVVVFGMVMAMILDPLIRVYSHSDILILIVQTLISTLIILFVAEFLPKTVFRISPNTFLKILSLPVSLFYILLYPVTWLIILISEFIMQRILGVPRERNAYSSVFGKVDLDHLVNESSPENGGTQEQEHEIKYFQRALDFSNVRLRDCMVPRTEIVALEESSTLEDLRQKFIETGLSKILIYNDSTDNITGFINSKELFKNPPDLKSMIMSIPHVPETMPANKLLQSFIKEHRSISVVVDEFGGTSGVVTLEDILEEILGEIEDEHDVSGLTEKQLNPNEYLFSARHEIDYLNEKYRLDIPKTDDYETLAGLLLTHYESIPKVNDRITIDNIAYRILDVSETRIELVQLTKLREHQN